MRSAKKKFGKQQNKTAKLGTENRRTQDMSKDTSFDGPLVATANQLDVKPTTQNPKLKTELLPGPFSYLHEPMLSLRINLYLTQLSFQSI